MKYDLCTVRTERAEGARIVWIIAIVIADE